MAAKVGVLLFPGSNCEQDVLEAFSGLGAEAELVTTRARLLERARGI